MRDEGKGQEAGSGEERGRRDEEDGGLIDFDEEGKERRSVESGARTAAGRENARTSIDRGRMG